MDVVGAIGHRWYQLPIRYPPLDPKVSMQEGLRELPTPAKPC